jgi:hypothetical protein
MSRLRVNSGTVCGGITQEHAARFSIDFVCSAFAAGADPAVLALHVLWRRDTMSQIFGPRPLDVSRPNNLLIAAGMGKPMRNELLRNTTFASRYG